MYNSLCIALVICIGSQLSTGPAVDGTPVPLPENVVGQLSAAQYEDILGFLKLVNHPGMQYINVQKSRSAHEKIFTLDSQAGRDYVTLDYDVRSSRVVGYSREDPRTRPP